MTRNVLITGGSSGIGRSLVMRFATGGDSVWFTHRLGGERATQLLAELARSGLSSVQALELSQGDWGSHRRLLDALPARIDVLINNAALGSKTVLQHVSGPVHEQDTAFMQVNCVGPLWLIRGLVPGMIERGYGKVVNVSSVGGGVALFPGFHIADGMSKAALSYLTRHLAAELVQTPVDVFAVCPGAVETPMLEASILAGLSPPERSEFEARLPKGRLIQPEEIAETIWWLCSESARVMHGAVIDASMGLGVHPGLLTSRRHGMKSEPTAASALDAGASR
jgi:NAD(P)-dependent dehydrogenase (short-subunit alcohol dehydrogenase family)